MSKYFFLLPLTVQISAPLVQTTVYWMYVNVSSRKLLLKHNFNSNSWALVKVCVGIWCVCVGVCVMCILYVCTIYCIAILSVYICMLVHVSLDKMLFGKFSNSRKATFLLYLLVTLFKCKLSVTLYSI